MLKSLAKLKKGGPAPTDAEALKKFYKKAAVFELDKEASRRANRRRRNKRRARQRKLEAAASVVDPVSSAPKPPPVSAPKPPPVPDAPPKKLPGMSKTKKGLLALAGTTLLAAGGKHLYDKKKEQNKEASVAQLSTLASLVEQGQMGKEAQYAFEGMTQAIDRYVEEDLTEKTASHAETDYTIYDENAARIARLDNLLRKL